jgi:predicted amidohydrolase
VEFPEATRALALAGADLIVVPTANMADYDFVARSLVPVRAYENQLFVAYANFTGPEGALQYGGLSVVAGPDGAPLAQAGRDEVLVFATQDEERLTAARNAVQHVRDLTALHNPPT